jgi:polyphenol oxidase
MNLGNHVGDDPACVAENRRILQQHTGAHCVFMEQVHGVEVLDLDAGMPDGLRADAAWSGEPGLACVVMVADCLPVLLTDAGGSRVAAAHAGWRGLCAGVLERTVEGLRRGLGDVPILAWLGPCIGPQAFEVGPEVREAFLDGQPSGLSREYVRSCFEPHTPGKYLANLPALARHRLACLGIQSISGNDGSPAWCTVGNPSHFFSHRRDATGLRTGEPATGRMAACIWRVGA